MKSHVLCSRADNESLFQNNYILINFHLNMLATTFLFDRFFFVVSVFILVQFYLFLKSKIKSTLGSCSSVENADPHFFLYTILLKLYCFRICCYFFFDAKQTIRVFRLFFLTPVVRQHFAFF